MPDAHEREMAQRDVAFIRTQDAVRESLPDSYDGPGLRYGFNAGWAAARSYFVRPPARCAPGFATGHAWEPDSESCQCGDFKKRLN